MDQGGSIMNTFSRFWKMSALILMLLILGFTPVAAQDSESSGNEQYIPFVAGVVPSVDQATAEEPTQPAQAAQVAAPAAILRHEPGGRSKVNDLDVRLAAGEISDPLAGNTTLVSWDKIALVYHAENNMLMHKTYDVAETLAAPVSKEDLSITSVGGGGSMDVAAGNLRGGNPGAFIDSVAAYENSGGKITIYVEGYHSGLLKSVAFSVITNDVPAGESTGSPQTGAEIRIPASKNPRFRASKLLKDSLN
jgi:hypothetical protein